MAGLADQSTQQNCLFAQHGVAINDLGFVPLWSKPQTDITDHTTARSGAIGAALASSDSRFSMQKRDQDS